MNVLLIFFALPVATVILAIVLQKILRNPLLVAATFFAIYLIVTFASFDASFLVYAILYTILAYITAVLTRLMCNLLRMLVYKNNSSYNLEEDQSYFSNIVAPNATNKFTQNSAFLTSSNLQNEQMINTNNNGCNFRCHRR